MCFIKELHLTNSKIIIKYHAFIKKISREFKSQQQKKQKPPLPAIPKDLKVSQKFRTFSSGLHSQEKQSPISFNTLPKEKRSKYSNRKDF